MLGERGGWGRWGGGGALECHGAYTIALITAEDEASAEAGGQGCRCTSDCKLLQRPVGSC